MDQEEIKATIKDAITSFIKGENDEAGVKLHDVLAAKMRNRIDPPAEITQDEETVIDSTDNQTD